MMGVGAADALSGAGGDTDVQAVMAGCMGCIHCPSLPTGCKLNLRISNRPQCEWT